MRYMHLPVNMSRVERGKHYIYIRVAEDKHLCQVFCQTRFEFLNYNDAVKERLKNLHLCVTNTEPLIIFTNISRANNFPLY